MATPTLRPLGVGEVLDVGIKLYLRHWKVLMRCVVWVVLPVQVLSVLITASVAPDLLRLGSGSRRSATAIAPGEAWTAVASQAVVGVLSILTVLLATAACFKAVADAYLGDEPDAGASLRFGLRRLPRLIWTSIVAGIGLVVAFLALIVPGIWLGVAWALAIPALLFEGLGSVAALRRSFHLVKGRWWPVAGALLVGTLLVSIVAGILQGLLQVVPAVVSDDSPVVNAVAQVIGTTVSSVLTTPYTAAVIALLYFDGRVRKEGFDLQLLAASLGREAPAEAARGSGGAPGLVAPEVTPEQRAAAPYWPPPPGWRPPEAPAPPAPACPEPAPDDRDRLWGHRAGGDDRDRLWGREPEPSQGREPWLPPQPPGRPEE